MEGRISSVGRSVALAVRVASLSATRNIAKQFAFGFCIIEKEPAMSDDVPQVQKLFTVEQVNSMLPLVRAIVRDLANLSREVVDRRERLAHLSSNRTLHADDPYQAELNQIEEELEKDVRRLRGYVEELRDLGAEPKNGIEGLVDFPAIIDGRVVYLCWKLDEPEVLFWHELEAGFQGRQRLPTGAALSSGSSSASSI
jgi:hypothetical protein